jgi:hypothetical protein
MIKLVCSLEREKKLTNLDERAIQDLVGELEEDETAAEDAKKQKATKKVQARLAHEAKSEAKKAKSKPTKKKGQKADDDEDMDEDDLLRFAKPSNNKKKI